MNFGEADVQKLRRKSESQARQQIAEYTLAGLRKPVYTGVFQKLTGTRTPTYICDLILDGHHRNLTIRLKALRTATHQNDWAVRYATTIQGLPFSSQQKRFELTRGDRESGSPYLKGTLDVGAAQLSMTVLPQGDGRAFDPWICVLEILRSES